MTPAAILLSLLLGDYANKGPLPQVTENDFKNYLPHVEKYFNDKVPESGYVLFDVIELSVERTVDKIEFDGKIKYHSDDQFKADVIFAPTSCQGEKQLKLSSMGPCRIRDGEFYRCSVEFSVPSRDFFRKVFYSEFACRPTVPNLPKYPELLGFELPENIREYYEEFKQKHNKMYSNYEEEIVRYQIFQKNYLRAQLYQVLEQGTAEYGVTPFSDLSEDEFKQTHLLPGWKSTNYITGGSIPNLNEPVPEHFDWREKGAVTEVKDQGSCGSCWAFSTTGNIETQWFRKSGKLFSLSEQQLVDCDGLDDGCGGGLPSNAYQSIIKMGGLMTEQDYPYDARREACHKKSDELKVFINGYVELPKNETLLAIWLSQNSTISVGVNAMFMQFYRHGVMHPWHFLCPASGLDHAVLLVGYGAENGKPYWIVKNSWGKRWGESGYARMYRGDGTCGINQVATSAVVF